MGIAELTAAVALILAAAGWFKVRHLQKEMSSRREEIDSLRRHVTASSSILEQKMDDIRRTMVKPAYSAGGRFYADMTVAEVLGFHPDAESVMASFHLGDCSSCAISDHHVLGPACESYGVDAEALLKALNDLLDGGSVSPVQARGENLIQVDTGI